MTSATLEAPLSLFAQAHRPRPAGGRGTTLEERLDGVLRAAQADGVAECPVCRAQMHAVQAAARCSGCGSTLA